MFGYTEEDIEAIRGSGLFDPDWYAGKYPDVRALGMDPLEHFLWVGARLRRDPSERFDTAAYLSENDDVAEAGINPLLHFIRTGKAEGREARPRLFVAQGRGGAFPPLHFPAGPRILAYSHNLNALEGAPTSLLELCRGLKAAYGLSIVVLSPREGELRRHYEAAGIPVAVGPMALSPFQEAQRGEVSPPAAYRIESLLREHRVEAVIANTALGFHVVHAARLAGVPQLFVIRESEDPAGHYAASLSPEWRGIFVEALRSADRLVFVSEATRERWMRSAGRRPGTVEVVTTGIDLDRLEGRAERSAFREELGLGPDDLALLAVGTLCRRKSQGDILDALKLVSPQKRAQMRLFLVGDVADEAYAAELVERVRTDPDLAGIVRLVPGRKDIGSFYRAADALVHAARLESYPRVVVEALHFSLPVIANPVFGVREQTGEGEAALHYDPERPQTLAARLEELLDPAARRRLAGAARARAGELPGFRSMVERYGDLLAGLPGGAFTAAVTRAREAPPAVSETGTGGLYGPVPEPEPEPEARPPRFAVSWLLRNEIHRGWAYANNTYRLMKELRHLRHTVNRTDEATDVAVHFDPLFHEWSEMKGLRGRRNVLRLGGPRPLARQFRGRVAERSDYLRRFDAIIALNADLAAIGRMSGVPTYLVPNGIDLAEWAPVHDPDAAGFTVGYAANLTSDEERRLKGFDFVEEACGDLGLPLMALRKGESQIPHERMREDFFGRISCLVHPVAEGKEGSSNTIMEALACGVPVVTTRDCGYHAAFLADGEDVLFAGRDAGSIARALTRLAGDRELRRRLSENGRRFAEHHHDIRKIAREYENVFASALRGEERMRVALLPFRLGRRESAAERVRCWMLADLLNAGHGEQFCAEIGLDETAGLVVVSELATAADLVRLQLLSLAGSRIVYDCSGPLFARDEEAAGVHVAQRFWELVDLADMVTVPDETLRRAMAEAGVAKPVVVLPDTAGTDGEDATGRVFLDEVVGPLAPPVRNRLAVVAHPPEGGR